MDTWEVEDRKQRLLNTLQKTNKSDLQTRTVYVKSFGAGNTDVRNITRIYQIYIIYNQI